jgi:NAD(P)-dependent dehydrogenase (short-subunit alcohol dehydrogenase family)
MQKTIFITGASSGIGNAAARLFAANHWNVVATMRTPSEASPLAQLPNVLLPPLDVQNPQSIDRAVAAAVDRFGRVDALVNNAGFSVFGVFETISPDKIREQFDVNVFGVMNVTRALLPHFRQNKSGLIINISSRGGIVGLPMNSLYCASKFALEGFSESLSYELASQNITIKLVQPSGGATNTNFSQRMSAELSQNAPIPDYQDFIAKTTAVFATMRSARMISSDDVAQVILQAATDGSSQLRYPVGYDNPPFIKARRELADQPYIDFMRSHFKKT